MIKVPVKAELPVEKNSSRKGKVKAKGTSKGKGKRRIEEVESEVEEAIEDEQEEEEEEEDWEAMDELPQDESTWLYVSDPFGRISANPFLIESDFKASYVMV